MKIKLAAYLDEASDSPIAACDQLVANGIKSTVLRWLWSTNVCEATDGVLDNVRTKLKASGIDVQMVCSNVGNVVPGLLSGEHDKLERAVKVCKFFKCKNLRLSIGTHAKTDKALSLVEAWLRYVSDVTIADDVRPVFEMCHDSSIAAPAALAATMKKFGRWGLVYDPGVLIATKRVDPFAKYWSLLKSKVTHVDLHDYITGKSACALGSGDGKIDLVLADAIGGGYHGWFCLEPGWIRKAGSATREESFRTSYDRLVAILNGIGS